MQQRWDFLLGVGRVKGIFCAFVLGLQHQIYLYFELDIRTNIMPLLHAPIFVFVDMVLLGCHESALGKGVVHQHTEDCISCNTLHILHTHITNYVRLVVFSRGHRPSELIGGLSKVLSRFSVGQISVPYGACRVSCFVHVCSFFLFMVGWPLLASCHRKILGGGG